MVDRYRNHQPRPFSNARSPKPRRGLYVVAIGLIVIFGGRSVWQHIQTSVSSKGPSNNSPKPSTRSTAEPIANSTWSDLDQRINALLAQNRQLDIGVSLIDVSSDTQANYGVRNSFAAASTTKVLTAAAYLHDVELGKHTLAEPLNGVAANTHLRRMINRSDNTSWEILNAAIGTRRLEPYARSIGLSSYKYSGNLITASDQALLLSKLFKGELVNQKHRALLLSLMQNTNNEDMIPVAAPVGATLYHKYGLLDDRVHDSAIITYKNKTIALVIYTKGSGTTTAYSSRIKLIRSIAQSVFSTIY